jgi:hypothetical protein
MEDALQNPDEHVKLRALDLLEAVELDSMPAKLSNRVQSLFDEYEGTQGTGNYIFRASEKLMED